MSINASMFDTSYNFLIDGVSYIGNPVSHTAMYVSKKIETLLDNLKDAHDCLVFAEDGIVVSSELRRKHCIVLSCCPQLEYSKFVVKLGSERQEELRKKKYTLTNEGYYIGENVRIGKNVHIEPMCFIDHDVVIGNNASIACGSVIRNAVIGNDFVCNEYACVGTLGFTMTTDEFGNKIRIPTLGKVIIGNSVEVGAHDNISCGSGGNTLIDDYVKLDALVHIGHDAHISSNSEVTAGTIVGGFVSVGENAFLGVNSTLRNRISIGDHAIVGMSAAVTKSVLSNTTVAGNPAKNFAKKD